eukprot:CAMPEP_0194320168 /NCGR_PEP_ID=MMETSP0171-20130528/16537_1 /TAXON_ID=218684 /ORGANISM="Corethron pennatum, Strain L29A3" /LENGTH=270 /DNA_ID=CAMNT_0039077633 /DNA_START=87 /DNA_END=899 /DNA_ORIENTATION=+
MVAQFPSSVAVLVVAFLAQHGATAFNVVNNPPQVTTKLDAVSRREAFVASVASASAAIIAGVPDYALAAAQGTNTPPAAKPDYKTAAKFYFNGVFRDKKHPNGYRIVAGSPNKAGSITLQDTPGGKVYELPMKAKRNDESGQVTVDMDLSEYKPDNPQYASIIATVTEDGCILFPDGNLWKKDKGVAGLYIDGFAPYPKYRRIVIPGQGSDVGKVGVTMVSGKQVFDVPGIDLGKKGIQVDFPGNKQCLGKFNGKAGTITWLDGNVWTKV